MKKRFGTKGMAALLAAAMLVTTPANVFAAPAQEPVLLGDSANSFTDMQVGENATATLQNGTLTVSGTGAMSDSSSSPFYKYENVIRAVVIEDGITEVGNYAFCGLSNVETLTLGNTVTRIGSHAFGETGIKKLVCPSSLRTIERGAFGLCSSLTSVKLNDGLEEVEGQAFVGTGIKEIEVPENCSYNDTSYYTKHYKTTVTLNANGGTVNGASTAEIVQYEKEDYGKPTALPTPVREGYDFLGWYDFTDGTVGAAVGDTKVAYHAVLIAQWCDHSNTTVKNQKTASYTAAGYSGDTYCADCGKRLELGHTTDKKKLASPSTSVKGAKSAVTVKWTKVKAAGSYQIQCSRSKSFGSGVTVKTAKKSASSIKISGLKSGKTYYVRVRTCKKVSGKNVYSAWTVKSVRVK